ncbi:hypothetical protein [Falsiroseomonas sp. E2-1-a20]|uniref:hypothetical protein n=1 Tax=Falsiroseomonas sp. E2-1-a20 TaxID=3239300 RepID=UPI003F41A6C8
MTDIPEDLAATVRLLSGDDQTLAERNVVIARAPGGDALKLIIRNVSADNRIIIRMRSAEVDRIWESAAMHPNEGFMPLNALQSGGQ